MATQAIGRATKRPPCQSNASGVLEKNSYKFCLCLVLFFSILHIKPTVTILAWLISPYTSCIDTPRSTRVDKNRPITPRTETNAIGLLTVFSGNSENLVLVEAILTWLSILITNQTQMPAFPAITMHSLTQKSADAQARDRKSYMRCNCILPIGDARKLSSACVSKD